MLGIAFVAAARTASPAAWSLLVGCLIARVALHVARGIGRPRPILSDLWLLPLCDLLIFWAWCRSLFTSRIAWRNHEFDVDADGVMHPLP
jgi:hypothetical protein